MIKVLIADDEHCICRLIEMLIDWKELGMEIVGVAHNGIEAAEMIKLLSPQILITDIRMPGKSGLELIEEVKKCIPNLEIVIISGYAHFEYAKNAIRFGVGDYLLKPISKDELNATLQKIKEKIQERTLNQEKTDHLIQKNKKDISRLQRTLIQHLIEQKEEGLSYDTLNGEYQLHMQPGLFQIVWIKLDHYWQEFNESGMNVILEKVISLVENSIRTKCIELLMGYSGSSCMGIMNYHPEKQDELRWKIKDCLNQLAAHREIFGEIQFSIALSTIVKNPEDISKAVKETALIIEERLLKGNGRLLERIPMESHLSEQKLPEKYLRKIRHAIDVHSLEEAAAVVQEIRQIVLSVRGVGGYEIAQLVNSCGELFLSQIGISEKSEDKKRFKQACEQCANEEELFGELRRLQQTHIQKMKQERESDDERPIRIAKQYMQKHYGEQITLEEVSNIAGLSPTYFSAQFKKSEGEGFAKYLIRIRIEQAKILLRETNLSISEICKKVGYNDQKHFTHTFEKSAGVKPSVFRKLYG